MTHAPAFELLSVSDSISDPIFAGLKSNRTVLEDAIRVTDVCVPDHNRLRHLRPVAVDGSIHPHGAATRTRFLKDLTPLAFPASPLQLSNYRKRMNLKPAPVPSAEMAS